MTLNERLFTRVNGREWVAEISELKLDAPPRSFYAFNDRFDLRGVDEAGGDVMGWRYSSVYGKLLTIIND